MMSLILACITCCCCCSSSPTTPNRKIRSFFTSPTTPKHKRPKHNPPITIPIPQPANSHTFIPSPNSATSASASNNSYTPRAKTTQDYTFEVLKIENERRVRKLAEAGVMDVPHGVLSREVGTPELAPGYNDVVGGSVSDFGRLRLEEESMSVQTEWEAERGGGDGRSRRSGSCSGKRRSRRRSHVEGQEPGASPEIIGSSREEHI